MIWVKRLILMIQFMTRIPIPIVIEVKDEDLSWGVIFFPIVGLVVGAVMAAGYYLGSLTSYRFLPALTAVAFQALITGVFHIDGLGDTFDGLFSNKNRERMLEIMKDSRIGTNAAAAIFLDLLFKILLISELTQGYHGWQMAAILMAMPIMGRIGIVTASSLSTYDRKEGGLGKAFVDGVGIRQWVMGLALGAVLMYLLLGLSFFIHTAAALLAAFGFTRFVESKIGGMTGDTLGAVNELCEVCFLVFFTAIQSLL